MVNKMAKAMVIIIFCAVVLTGYYLVLQDVSEIITNIQTQMEDRANKTP